MGQTISSCSDSPPNYGDYAELKSQPDTTTFYLHIHPRKLKFPYELGKKVSCSLKLSNKSDDYVAFKITCPKKYSVKPKIGVVLPRSTCDVTVLIQSIIATPGATTKDITSEMAMALISKLLEERKSLIEQNKRLQQELNVLRRETLKLLTNYRSDFYLFYF